MITFYYIFGFITFASNHLQIDSQLCLNNFKWEEEVNGCIKLITKPEKYKNAIEKCKTLNSSIIEMVCFLFKVFMNFVS